MPFVDVMRTYFKGEALEAAHQSDAQAMANDELPRMQKVVANFKTTFIAAGVLALIGLILLYALSAEWAAGVGAAFVLAAGLVLVVDGVASRRAHPYVNALEAIAGQGADAPATQGTP